MKMRNHRVGARRSTRVAAGLCVVLMLQLEVGGLLFRGEVVSQAFAAEIRARKMAVLVVPKGRKDAKNSRDLEFMLRGFVARLQDVEPVDLSPIADVGNEAEVAKLVKQGFDSLAMGKPLEAKVSLEAAKAVLDAKPATGDVRLWARYHKAQALTELAQHKLLEASNHLVKSLTMFRAQTDAEYIAFGMRARQLLRTVMSAVDRQDTGDLEVKRGTKGAEIWLDGKYAGRVPNSIPDVKAGVHRIALRKSGMAAVRENITISVGKTLQFSRKLKRARIGLDLAQGRALLRANFKKQTVIEDRIRELADTLGANMMMVVQARTKKTSTVFTGYFLDSEGGFQPVATELNKDEHYLDNMGGFVAQSAAVTLTDGKPAPLDPRSVVVARQQAQARAAQAKAGGGEGGSDISFDKLKDKWWFWAAVGGGVVVLGSVGYLIFSDGEQPPVDPTGTLSVNLHKTSGK